MSMKEFVGTYLPVEDRVMIRLVAADHQEYRLLFTRRILIGATEIIERVSDQQLAVIEGKESVAPGEVAQFRKEAIQQATQFGETPHGGAEFPMGETPILVKGFRMTKEGALDAIMFDLVNAQTLTMRVPVATSYQFCLLLTKMIAKAGWSEPVAGVAEQSAQPRQAASGDAPSSSAQAKRPRKKLH